MALDWSLSEPRGVRAWPQSADRAGRMGAVGAPAAGLLVGLGLAGAALDGLLIQQVLGWHPLTADRAALGHATSLYFAATLAILLAGLDLLFRIPAPIRRRSRRTIAGWTLLGVGLFELLVGAGDHHLAAVRHLRPGAAYEALWDLAYLGLGLAFVLAGTRLLRRGAAQLSRPARSTARSSGLIR